MLSETSLLLHYYKYMYISRSRKERGIGLPRKIFNLQNNSSQGRSWVIANKIDVTLKFVIPLQSPHATLWRWPKELGMAARRVAGNRGCLITGGRQRGAGAARPAGQDRAATAPHRRCQSWEGLQWGLRLVVSR